MVDGAMPHDVFLDHAMAEHEKFTCSQAAPCRVIDDVRRVVRQWRVCFSEVGVPQAVQDKIASAIRHLNDIAIPELRKRWCPESEIRYGKTSTISAMLWRRAREVFKRAARA